MDGLDYNEPNSTNCLNISDSVIKQFQYMRIVSIINILLLMVPTSIVQLFFIYRYKSTLIVQRQILYTTVVFILLYIILTLYSSTVDAGCPSFYLLVTSLNWYLFYVEMMQITTIHLLLLYQLCKHIETRTMQRLQTLCSNIRPRLWHDVIIVCIQFGLPLPILIVNIVGISKTNSVYIRYDITYYVLLPIVAVNMLLGLICIVLLMVWFCVLKNRRLLKSKVCTQISHILIVLVVLLIYNITYFYDALLVVFALRTVAIVFLCVYIIVSLSNLRINKKAQVPATNRHTNPPSTRVSLPTDTAEHAPNFLSPSTAELSEVTPLINN